MKILIVACVVLCGVAGSGCHGTKEPPKNATVEPAKIAVVPKEIKVDLGGGVQMEMTLIPAGEFMMGSGESAEETVAFFNKMYGYESVKAEDFKDEHPQHLVRIAKPFYMGTYHVTRGQFRQFVAETHYLTDAEKGIEPETVGGSMAVSDDRCEKKYSWRDVRFEQTDEHPVICVSWNDAYDFCDWLSKKEGKRYRLPTEAEWEYACRAGTTTRYSSGDAPETLAQVGNVADGAYRTKFPFRGGTIKANDGYVFTAPVGKFKPNAFGLFDMHGNSYQWCQDWYDIYYYAWCIANDPIGPFPRTDRVLRGGCWKHAPQFARSACRFGAVPTFRSVYTSFRVGRTD